MAWIPLESNPEVLNKFLRNTGVRDCWKFIDVYSLDEECLSFIEGPVIALVMLFPCDSKYEKRTSKKIAEIKKKKQFVSPRVFFMKQLISNACGAVAVIHSVANNNENDLLKEGDGELKKFLEAALPLNPLERGLLLENADVIAEEHYQSANDGQTTPPSPDTPSQHHYLSLVEVDGHLYELDGRKEFPINHGQSSNETFLSDAARVCREYMASEPGNLNFTVLALVRDDNPEQHDQKEQ